MRLRLVAISMLLLTPLAARSEGGFSCRWLPGTTQVAYSAFPAKEAAGTDVRAMLQGALLVEASGAFPRFAALTPSDPEAQTAPLICGEAQSAPADGMLELTFTRRVRLGIDYTLGRCQLFYRCPARAGEAPAAPELVLEFLDPPRSRHEEPATPRATP